MMGYDEVSLIGAPTNWPWDEVFFVNGDSYSNFCKPFSYDIVYKGTNMPVNFVGLEDGPGILKLYPNTFSPIGISVLTLRTKLFVWPSYNVIDYQDFSVEVTECVPSIDSNG